MSDSPMVFDLVVTVPFGSYSRGDAITDPAAITAVLLTNANCVVQILQVAGEPTPAS